MGRWLEMGRTLEYYHLKNGVSNCPQFCCNFVKFIEFFIVVSESLKVVLPLTIML